HRRLARGATLPAKRRATVFANARSFLAVPAFRSVVGVMDVLNMRKVSGLGLVCAGMAVVGCTFLYELERDQCDAENGDQDCFNLGLTNHRCDLGVCIFDPTIGVGGTGGGTGGGGTGGAAPGGGGTGGGDTGGGGVGGGGVGGTGGGDTGGSGGGDTGGGGTGGTGGTPPQCNTHAECVEENLGEPYI